MRIKGLDFEYMLGVKKFLIGSATPNEPYLEKLDQSSSNVDIKYWIKHVTKKQNYPNKLVEGIDGLAITIVDKFYEWLTLDIIALKLTQYFL